MIPKKFLINQFTKLNRQTNTETFRKPIVLLP